MRAEDKWGAVQTVLRRSDFDVYAEAPPSVLKLPNGSILAVWAQKRNGTGKWPGNYLYAAASQDNGKTWSSPVRVHSDQSNSEHSFSSIAATARDRATVIWLDARDYEKNHRYRIMSAVLNSSGQVAAEKTIDDDTCTCCPTAFVSTPDITVAAYRGHTPQEIRDIKISRLLNGKWTAPRTVHDDGWQINGCPVNGPALSVNKDRVAVVWFTGKDDKPQVKMAVSRDSGKTFGQAQTLDSPGDGSRPIGHVGISLLDDGSAVAVWIQQGPSDAKIVGQRISGDMLRSRDLVLAKGTARRLGYPRLVSSTHAVIVSWGGAAGQEITTGEMRISQR
jgi:hypothetical protein